MIMKGQKINDRYQIIKSIGEGGMANVYLAYDTILDRNVAIKVLRGDLATDDKFIRRFQREALSASSLNHPNIVEVYDVGEDNGQYYIVMEYIEGKHLKALVKKRGSLTVSEVIDIMLQITEGLTCAHDSYIIHRDIKPQNIMILENGLVKITDFGIAMATNATQLTQTNTAMGSVHYFPPEQASGKGSTLKSDIYSMGIVMYELLTGKLPYKGDNAVEIALKHLKEPLPSLREELPEIPQSVENIILKATAKNPKNRYNDAREMHEDLKTCLGDERLNEAPYVYPHPETDDDVKPIKNTENVNTKKVAESGEVPIAKQITETDLKKQNKLLIRLAAIFTGLVVIVTTLVFFLPMLANQKEITVPDVANMDLKEAIKTLQDAGFKVNDDQKELFDEDVEEGKIIKTNPAAESKRTKGTAITLYISMGSNSVEIEDYTGKQYLEIETRLKEVYGLYVIIETKEVDNKDGKYKDGQIIDQSVKAGTKLTAKDTITLYIPDIVTKFPDFTDGTYSLSDIEAFCEEYNITLSVEYVEDSSEENGKIFYQSRPEGYTIVAGSSIKIKIYQTEELIDEADCSITGLC